MPVSSRQSTMPGLLLCQHLLRRWCWFWLNDKEKQAKERKAVSTWCECRGWVPQQVVSAATGQCGALLPLLMLRTTAVWKALLTVSGVCYSHKLISPKVQFFEKIIKCLLHSKSWSFLIRGSSLCCAFYLKSTSDRQCTWSYSSMGNFSLAFMSYWHGMSPALALMPVSTPAVRKSWLSRRRQQRTGRVGFKLPEDGLTNGDTLRQQSFEILP